jgi:BASS family bile acid:Na+ symporter
LGISLRQPSRRTIIRFVTNRNVIFSLAFGLGIIVGQYAENFQSAVLPALALVMIISTIQMPSSTILHPSALARPMLLGVFFNFAVQGTVVLVLARLFMPEPELWTGFVLLAAVPPAVAVIPFARILKADTALALIGTIGVYIAALVVTPLMTLILLGENVVQTTDLLLIVAELVIIPLVLSRVIRGIHLEKQIEPWSGTITNWSFFVVIYIAVGVNREVFLSEYSVLALTFGVGIASTFILGFIIEWVTKALEIDPAIRSSLMLLGTLKNYGMAAAIALTQFSDRAAIPPAVMNAVAILYFVYLGFRADHQKKINKV